MKIRDDQFIHLMADCYLVEGATHSAIYDLSRGDIHSFPSAFFDTFDAFEQHPYGALKALAVEAENLEVFEAFIAFLDERDMVMALDEHERALFPKIDMNHWDKPCVIQNAIIDVKEKAFDFKDLFGQLDQLGCEFVQIRQYGDHFGPEDVDGWLRCAYDTSILGVELLLAYDPRHEEEAYRRLVFEHPIIASICIHSAPETKRVSVDMDQAHPGLFAKTLIFNAKVIDSSDHCGVIDQSSFAVPRTEIVSEFRQFNGCLNRKISVDHEGCIKNCPSMSRSYGHIGQMTLIEALATSGFKDVWTHRKDEIEVCKVCEYRYVCSDCRVFTQDDGVMTKPEKCAYDPHTGVWTV